jgi:predicted DNA-binding transcriptional regulator AlpA
LEVAQTERQLSDFFSRSNVGLAVLDESLSYQMVNPYLAATNRTSVESHLGKHVREILGSVGLQVEPAIKRAFSTAEPVLNCELAGALPARPEGGQWIVTLFPIADSNGKIRQVGAVVVELGENVQLEALQCHPSHRETVLRSWKDIAHYVGTSVKTVQRWERAYEFPVRRVEPNKGSVVFAFQNEVDQWLHGRKLHAQFPLRVPPHERRKRD